MDDVLLLFSVKTIQVVNTTAEEEGVNLWRFSGWFCFNQRTATLKNLTKVTYYKLNVILIMNLKLLTGLYKYEYKVLKICICLCFYMAKFSVCSSLERVFPSVINRRSKCGNLDQGHYQPRWPNLKNTALTSETLKKERSNGTKIPCKELQHEQLKKS